MGQLTVIRSTGCGATFTVALFPKGPFAGAVPVAVSRLGGKPVIDGMPSPESIPGPHGIIIGLGKAPLPKPVDICFGSMTLRLVS